MGPVVCAFGALGALLKLTPTTLYSCSCDGVLRAISPANGQVRYEWGAGTCSSIFAGDTWTLLKTSSGLVRLDWAALEPARSVTVRGRVLLDGLKLSFPRWGRVGPKLVRTDGRFRTDFRGGANIQRT
jgi:hypothetical protein